MAPAVRSIKRKDAINWPRMSTTFWAVLLLTALLIVYCGQLAAGTCEIVTLDRDSSQPRRTIARQTARCACKKGQIAGTTRARPACVDGLSTIVKCDETCCVLQSVEVTHRIIHRAQTQNALLLGLEIEDHFLRALEYFHCTFLLSDM
ncbi:unnamed protein product [Leuciscus chuanchicus]